MPEQLTLILPYLLFATGAGLLGGVVSLFWSPGPRARSAVQHFAAGAVLSAIATSVIPDAGELGTPTGVLIGFAAGGLVMIIMKWLVLRIERKSKQKVPLGLASAAAVDTVLDGAIITAGFFTGQGLGILLVAALSVELFFLTMSVGVELRKLTLWQKILITSGIALMMMVGSITAGFLLADVEDSILAIVLSFGAAALIYLIAEELLVETIQAEESLFSTATLFGGFLVLLAFKLLS